MDYAYSASRKQPRIPQWISTVKTWCFILKKQMLEKLMQAFPFRAAQKCNSLSQMAPGSDSFVERSSLDCNQRIRFCVWNTPAATRHRINNVKSQTLTSQDIWREGFTLIITPDNTWNVWDIYLRATCLHMWHACACTVISPLADATCSVVVIITKHSICLQPINNRHRCTFV